MYVKVLSAIFLIVTIAQVHCEEKGLPLKVEKCYEKLHITEEYVKSLKVENLTKEDKSKILCTWGCQVKTNIANDGQNDGQTIYQYVLESVEKGDDKAKVAALTQGLNSCSNVGDDECKFIECLENTSQEWKKRVGDWVTFVLS